MEKSIRQDILDKLFLASQEPGKRVVATLIIDGGDVGKVEASFLVDRRIMTRLTDLLDNIGEDQLRTG
jgi:hypothetical protein